MRRVYFDHSATTPVHPLVAEEVYRFMVDDNYGNPSSLHYFGQIARRALDEAREKVAKAIGAKTEEIIFTSGGTEADNMAVHGAAVTNSKKGNHIIISALEHHATLNAVKALAKQGYRVTILPVDEYGLVSAEQVAEAVKDETIMVSIMQANNEVGTVMPIAEIGRMLRGRGVIFHVDAVQSFGKLPVQVDELGVDLLAISGHKFYGPKGVGALYVRKGTNWRPTLFHGGSQERLRRAGTENIPGIVGLGKAAELAVADMEAENTRLLALRDKLINGIMERFAPVRLTGHPDKRLPNHASFIFDHIEGESLLLGLDMQGIAVSTGSACTAGSLEPSHVLLTMGIPPELAYGSLRLSLGRGNTEEDVEYFFEVLGPIAERLRAV